MHVWPQLRIWRPCHYLLNSMGHPKIYTHRHRLYSSGPSVPPSSKPLMFSSKLSSSSSSFSSTASQQGNHGDESVETKYQKHKADKEGAQRVGGPYTTPQPPRIYIVGTGNIGCLVAHALRSIHPRRPITLLMHRQTVAKKFESMGGLISVERNRLTVTRKGFEVEINSTAIENLLPYAQAQTQKAADAPGMIEHLIVTTKGHQARLALEPLAKRLTPSSTVTFIQNGMGVIDEINELYFPTPSWRPHYIVGIATHGLSSTPDGVFEPFTVVVNGVGTLKLGVLQPAAQPQSMPPSLIPSYDSLPPTTSYLLNSLVSAADLVASHVSPQEVLCTQLEKLAINAVINPLTVIFNCLNGTLLNNAHATKVIKLLLWEISQVLCALPEMQSLPNKDLRFSTENLYNTVVRTARATSENASSMLQDIRKGIPTEVDYINGYVVRKGLELKLPCSMNYMVQSMVKAKERMAKIDRQRELPIQGVEIDLGADFKV